MKRPSPIEAKANTTGDWRECVEDAWNTASNQVDWLALEATLRAYVKATGNKDVDEIVAAFTKRGGCFFPFNH